MGRTREMERRCWDECGRAEAEGEKWSRPQCPRQNHTDEGETNLIVSDVACRIAVQMHDYTDSYACTRHARN